MTAKHYCRRSGLIADHDPADIAKSTTTVTKMLTKAGFTADLTDRYRPLVVAFRA